MATHLRALAGAPREVDSLPADLDPTHAFLLHAADALHRFGTPSHRLEAALDETAAALDVEMAVFATPTMLMAAFGPPERQRVVLLRVQPAEHDLARLAHVDRLMRDVAAQKCSLTQANYRLRELLHAPPRWPAWAHTLAGGVGAAGAAVLFQGSLTDVGLSLVLGLVVMGLEWAARSRRSLGAAFLTLSTLLAASVGRGATWLLPDVHPMIVTISAVIVLVPGLSFTTAMMELATQHLASGVARLAAAGMTLLRLTLGVAVAYHLVPVAEVAPPEGMPPWTLPVVVALAAMSFGVALQARKRDLPVIVVASGIGFLGARLGAEWLGPIAGAGLGAFLLTAFGHLWSRRTRRPAAIPLVTGILLLVPGSVGVRSLTAMLEGQVLTGVEQAFHMAMVAVSLAAGMAFAATVVPPKQAL